jgi:RHS repeat-associated protein
MKQMHKHFLFGIFFLFMHVFASAQATLPAAYANTTKVNYVRTWQATAPETDPAVLITRPLKDTKQSTDYFDGLGRPLQTVMKQGSLQTGIKPVDLVSPMVYDTFGREVYKYLPFAANSTGNNTSLSDGLFKLNPFQQQAGFATSQYAGETFFYSQTNYEPSPLNREIETFAPGNSWVGTAANASESARRSKKIKNLVNTAADEVRIWNVSNVINNFGIYNTLAGNAGVYSAGQLYKSITVDEHGTQVIEFNDKEGQVILKKVQLTAAADNGTGSSHTGWLCTYYIYDEFNLLRAVIQPRGVELLIKNGWDITSLNGDILKEQCFRYEYDSRKRMIMKKVPGTGTVQMVYDARDRLVMAQDANLRLPAKKQWLVTKYDQLNRVVATYIITDPSHYNNAGWHRDSASISISYPVVADYSNELLTETHFDDYTGIPAGCSSGLLSGYGTNLDASSGDYPDPLIAASDVTGLVTWTRVKVLAEDKYIVTCNIYDQKKRVIQVQSINYTGAMDIITNRYSFSGQLLRSHIKHQKGGGNAQSYELATKNSYDELGRIIAVEKKLNGSGWKQMATMTYDALGQMKKKTLSPTGGAGAGPLDSLEYDYNIRGWLLGTNRAYAKSTTRADHYFGFDLGYDKQIIPSLGQYDAAQYNGNIAGTVWKSKGDGEIRKYDFSYDPVNRLTGADFKQYKGGFIKDPVVDFSVSDLSYDANGNILTQTQKGLTVGSSKVIDQLTYTYEANSYSNRLKNVVDAQNHPQTKLGDFRSSQSYMTTLNNVKTDQATDYNYDDNGNLTLDKNKDITSITYNHLNLPQTITVANKDSIEYVYDASGTKLKKVVHETGRPDKTTLYLFGIYENDTLQFLPMEEGRIRPVRDANKNTTAFTYDYFVKDHLGNVRMMLTEETKTNNYVATMERGAGNAVRDVENQLFSNLNASEYATDSVPGGYPPGSSLTNPNHYVARVNGSTQKKGPALVLKVMTGDTVNIGVKYFYRSQGATPLSGNALNDILSTLAGGIISSAGDGKGSLSQLSDPNSSALLGALNSFRQDKNSDLANKPKAYLNWILLDEQFRYVGTNGQSNALPVGAVDQVQPLASGDINITKNGYLYIYVSNETQNWDVFFDDMVVVHHTGPLLEETHYYPFGLTMAGISSRAMNFGAPENRKKFNGIEHTTDLELNQYDAFFRTLDPQIGRFLQIDPKIESAEAWSPYSTMLDDPIKNIDPLGDSTIPGAGFWRNAWEGLKDGAKSTGQFISSLGTTEGWKNLAVSFEASMMTVPVSAEGVVTKTQMVNNAEAAIQNIPNMTKDDWGHALGFGVEKVGEAVVLSKGAGLVKNGVGTTTLYRAASATEVTDMASNGVRTTSTGYETGKLFATSAQDATQFGKFNFGLDGTPNTVVKVKVPNSVMKTATTFEADGMKAVSIPSNQLQQIKWIKPLNYSPKPTNPFGGPGW